MKKLHILPLLAAFALATIPPVCAMLNTENEHDYQMGTVVSFTGTGTEEYTLTVPAQLNPGKSGTVKLEGQWPYTKTIRVTADETVQLVNSLNNNNTKDLNVDFAGIQLRGSNVQSVYDEKTVQVANINNALFGKWSGTFYYYVDAIERANIPVFAVDKDGNDLHASAYEIPAEEKEFFLEKLDESNLLDIPASEIDAIIEVESDDFKEFAETTFDVSSIAKPGDNVVILHFDEAKQTWEYITTAPVDENGKIHANFSNYSPVGFVVIENNNQSPSNPDEGDNIASHIYYEQPYVLTTGIPVEFIFHEDGSATMWAYDALTEYVPKEDVTYKENEIVIFSGTEEEAIFTLSEDKKSLFYSALDAEMRLHPIESNPIQSGVFTADPLGMFGVGNMFLELYNDKSFVLSDNGNVMGPIPGTYITDHGYYWSIPGSILGETDDTIVQIHPSGKKLSASGLVFVNLSTYEGLQFERSYIGEFTEDGEVTSVEIIFHENGAADIYMNGELTASPEGTFTYTAATIVMNDEIIGIIGADGTYVLTDGIFLVLENPCSHIATTVKTVEATCSQRGYTNGVVCIDCGKLISADQIFAPKGHVLDNGVIVQERTCTQAGKTKYSCTRCSYSRTETEYATGHVYPADDYVCTVCGYENLQNYTLSASDYAYKTGIDITQGDVVIPSIFRYDTPWGDTYWYRVTEVGYNAFAGCSELRSITLPETVTKINGRAFDNCTSLTNVYFGTQNTTYANRTTSQLQTISYDAFANCTSLVEIQFPASLKVIEYAAFQNCASLKKVTFAKNSPITTLESNSFENCAITSIGLQGSNADFIMPENLTTIRDKAFAGCVNLTDITLPNTTTSVAAYSFADCRQITTVTTPTVVSFAYWFAPWSSDGEGYTYISRSYSGTYVPTSLKTVTVTGDTVAYEAFYGWTTLENVILTENVKTIERYAFYHNSGLTSLSLPSSISKLESWSFRESQIDEIHIPSMKDWCEIEFEHLAEPNYNNPNSINHYYPEVLTGSTLYINNEPVIDLVLPDDITEIPDNAFRNYRNLKTLQVKGQNLQRIGVDAFYNTGLTTAELQDSVAEISGWAFAECNLLESIALPASLTTIEERTFYYCRQLNNVVIPDSVTSIGDYAFFACTALSNITFSANLKTIGNSAFNTCYVLRSPALPEGLKSIGDFAFGNGHVSGYLRIPSTVEELGVSILLNSGMGTIYVTSGNQHFSVEGDVLYNFDKTKMVTSTAYMSGTFTIPSTVKTICSGAFNDTQFLTGIVIPASVTKIETRAMGDCESVTSLKFLGTKAQWLAIEKEEGWNKTSYGGMPVTTITCSDGVLSLS